MKRMGNWRWSQPGQDFGVTPGGKLKNWKPGKLPLPTENRRIRSPGFQIFRFSPYNITGSPPGDSMAGSVPESDASGRQKRSLKNMGHD
jgi:hypothetical protein